MRIIKEVDSNRSIVNALTDIINELRKEQETNPEHFYNENTDKVLTITVEEITK